MVTKSKHQCILLKLVKVGGIVGGPINKRVGKLIMLIVGLGDIVVDINGEL